SVDPSEARLAELDAEDDLEAPEEGRHRKHGKRHGSHEGPSAEICAAIECTDAQQEQVKAIFARPERGERPEHGERPDLSAAHADLAKAFATANFDEADILAWAEGLPSRSERPSHRLDAMSELHAILTAEQRSALAQSVSAGEVFANRRGGKRHSKEGDKDSNRRVQHFCEPLDCTEDQETELAAVFAEKHASRPDSQARQDAIAEAFKADTFDAEGVQESCGHDPADEAGTLALVHRILTAEQRTILAERIAEHGPGALMGKGGGHGRHRKGRGRRGSSDVEPDFG
ncbi:MAG: Spy/CpxP family protein refolding chaperone, partial [Nannocystaceae bacterium]|nr:Spy/CpxP family protein refolding chaperone [Nannocystaceae bacterium]